jgi:hypothetical protein
MQEAATPETGPADAPASVESIVAELNVGTGDEAPANDLEEITQELVNDTEGTGEAEEAPQTEEDATEADADEPTPAEDTPEGTEEADAFAKLLATNPDLMVKIKVNGETIEVPLSELPNGYSRTQDYKAKTAEAAELRREAEAVKANAHSEAQAQYANQLEEATNLFAQYDPVLSEARNIDWDALKRTDPAAYVQAQDAVQERLTAIQQMNQHVAQVRQQSQQQQEQQLQTERAQRFDQAAEAIVKERPELADEGKFKAFANDAVSTLKEVGFTGEEIVDALDHRVLKLVDLAREGMAARAAKQSLPERKVVPKSAIKSLTSDGSNSRSSKPRFPSDASSDRQVSWIVDQLRNSE